VLLIRREVMIAIDRTGQGSPIVLLHGVGANRTIWRHVTPMLASRRTVVAPDIPGFGESPPAGDGFGLEETADALAGELERLVGAPFDLVGNSLGGAVALALAGRRPELVRRLVLSAPAGLSPAPAVLAAALGAVSGPAITARALVSGPLARSAAARRLLLFGAIASPQHLAPEEARALLQASRGSARIGAGLAAVVRADLRPVLTGLRLPPGFIWGERDRVVPISTLQAIRELRPDAVTETLPGVAHVPQIEAPAEFVSALRRVLERLPADRARR
jgi:pimeloyl-ACP methyl ester carboxylesterase